VKAQAIAAKVPDSERHEEKESTDNLSLKQQIPRRVTFLNRVNEAGAGGRSE